jgi:hypothetical protein
MGELMAKHRAPITAEQLRRDQVVKERFNDTADRIDSGELSSPHYIWTNEACKHSATPGIRQWWSRHNGRWTYEGDNLEDRLNLQAQRQQIYTWPYGAWSNYDQERHW